MRSSFVLIFIFHLSLCDFNAHDLILPKEHYEHYFKNNLRHYDEFCSNQQVGHNDFGGFNCSTSFDELRCWGYEKGVKCFDRYPIQPFCTKTFANYKDLNKNREIFYDESDFGYLAKKKEELKFYCKPKEKGSSGDLSLRSYLKCTDFLRFCEGENIFIDFERLNTIEEPMRYRTDVLEDGNIGGFNCELDVKLLNKQNSHKSPLQSWFEELEHFTVLNANSSIINKKCDLTIDKVVYIMKLDATVNMYHHFCDFINLYLSLHLANDFSLDKQILIWDTNAYRSNFFFTWNAFTRNKLLNLNLFKGKTVCFKHVVFPFLPRMIYGLYYNMPLIRGCKRSGLFDAFNRHLLNGLNILKNQDDLFRGLCDRIGYETCNQLSNTLDNKTSKESNDKSAFPIEINITFLIRSTAYRKILNEDELIERIRNESAFYKVTKVDFNHRMPFKNQLEISSQTDLIIGLHGAGLTHSLFLPIWGAIFEIFNCGDPDCYKDLARLRGLKYITWKDKRKLKYIKNEDKNRASHLKFTDYYFDENEFMKRFNVAIDYVQKRKSKYFMKFMENERKNKKQIDKVDKLNYEGETNDDVNKKVEERGSKVVNRDEL